MLMVHRIKYGKLLKGCEAMTQLLMLDHMVVGS